MNIRYIKNSFFLALAFVLQFMCCSLITGRLDGDVQRVVQKRFSHTLEDFSSIQAIPLGKHKIKKLCPAIVSFDFFNTVFVSDTKISSQLRESKLFPENEATLYTFDVMVDSLPEGSARNVVGNKMVVAMFQNKIQLWKKKDSGPWEAVSTPRQPIYNALHVEPVVKSSLDLKAKKDWLRDPEGLKKLIDFLLDHKYKVAFYGFVQCPHLIPFTLKHIGLTEKQIRNIYMLFSSSKSESDPACMCAIYHIIPELNRFDPVDYQLILGEHFYSYACRCSRLQDSVYQDRKVLNIAMSIAGSNIYEWKRLEKLVEIIDHFITTCETQPEYSISWRVELLPKLKRLGFICKLIR